jgi:hypothetical protein
MHQRFQALLVLLGLAPAAVACLLGYTMTRNDARYTWFVGPRPITTAAIGRARVAAGIKGMLWAYALLFVTLAIVFRVFFPGHPLHTAVVQDLRETTNTSGPYLEGMLMLAFYFAVVVLGVWSLFWVGRAAGVAVWVAGLVGGLQFWRLGQLYVVAGGAEDSSPVLMTFVYALTALAVAGLLLSYVVACKRGHVSPRGLVGVAVAAVVLGVVAFACGSFLPTRRTWLVALWLAVPVIPFATLPLTIDRQRHG